MSVGTRRPASRRRKQAFAGEETAMLVDMGTNTEVVLKHRGRMLAASCPAGPAFEGGLVR